MKQTFPLAEKLQVSADKLEFLLSEGYLSRKAMLNDSEENVQMVKGLLEEYEPIFKKELTKIFMGLGSFTNIRFLEDAIQTTFQKNNLRKQFKSGKVLLKMVFDSRKEEILARVQKEYHRLMQVEIKKIEGLEAQQLELLKEIQSLRNKDVNINEIEKRCNALGQLILTEKTLLTHIENSIVFEESILVITNTLMSIKEWTFDKMKEMGKKDGYVLQDFKALQNKTSLKELLTKNLEMLLFKTKEVDTLYQQYFEKHLSNHPKDEYPDARMTHRYFYIHHGPTNSGKTYDSLERLKKAKNGVYLSPLRLLALEVFEKLNDANVPCNLLTGEEEVLIPNAKHVSSTVEKLSLTHKYEVAVIDEAQMIADSQRGHAWVRAILGVIANEIHLCCSSDALPLLCELLKDCDETYELIEHSRATPLLVENNKFKFPGDIKKGDALIVFSRRSVIALTSHLNQLGHKVSVIYGNLPPETRKRQVKAFADGETDVVVSTDAIGMGLNLPVKRIVFMELEKYDGEKTRLLRTKEILQIAGRAGRRGLYEVGLVNCVNEKPKFANIKPTEYLKEKIKSSLRPLEFCYIHPDEDFIVNFPIGNIQKRLRAWRDHELHSKIFLKTDIDVLLELIAVLKSNDLIHRLTNGEIYKLINLPFDEKNPALIDLWLTYANKISEGIKEFDFPFDVKNIETFEDLSALETMYHKLNLYYSLIKNFKIQGDVEKVYIHREKIAVRIHEILKSSMSKISKCCSSCKTVLHWSHPYSICEGCYEKRRR